MSLTVAERGPLRKRVKNMTPQFKKSEIINHFLKEGIARSTIYITLNKLPTSQQIYDKKKTARLNSWTPQKKEYLRDRTGVSQKKLGIKFQSINQLFAPNC
jgi:hypothetical protein